MEEGEGGPSLVDLFSQLTYEKRINSYKSPGETAFSQKRRREERLKAQQQSRYNFQKLVRATLEKCAAGVETSERGEEIVEEMPVVEERGKKRKAGEISAITTRDKAAEKAQQKYKDSLMTPEPLEDLPDKDDLAKNWLCVPLPPGRRVLVVANNNATQIRLRNGSLLTSFQSLLPGGGTRHATSRMHCILDCMLCEPFTLYVLDVLVWKGDLYYDCDSEFRSFWTYNKLQEEERLATDKPYNFMPLSRFPCCPDSLDKISQTVFPFGKPAGYFLYHKESHYWAGDNPLMGHVIDLKELL